MSPAVPRHCPYLGLESDPHSIESSPARANCCFALGGPEPVALDYQQRYCLSKEHPACPLYRRAAQSAPLPATAPAPPAVLAEASDPEQELEPEPRASGWLDRIVLLVTLGALLFAIVYFGALFFQRAPASTDLTPLPLASRLPTATARGAATPTPTPTARPAAVTAVAAGTRPPPPTPPAGVTLTTLTPALDGSGWVVSSEHGGNHLGDPLIRAGVLEKAVYFGLVQFDLSTIPSGGTAAAATLDLTGARSEHFAGNGLWQVRIVNIPANTRWSALSFDDVRDLQWDYVFSPALAAEQMAEGRTDRLQFSAPMLAALQQQFGKGRITFRIDGPLSGADDLFAWESGTSGSPTLRPSLYVGTLPANDSAAPMVVIPCVPTPADPQTRAAEVATASYIATVFGTPTPYPSNYATPVVVTPTPSPDSIFAAATQVARATTQAASVGTATATAVNQVVVSVITATPPPANPATATYQAAYATALAATTGTPTPLPCFVSLVTSTPTPLVMYNEPTLMPTPLPTATPAAIPEELRGRIAFTSDREGAPAVYIMNPDGSHIGRPTSRWAYDFATLRQAYHGSLQLAVIPNPGGNTHILLVNAANGQNRNLVENGAINYDPAWSPDGLSYAFVSTVSGRDEIYLATLDSGGPRALTSSVWEWNKRPSFSPDGRRIVWWSNRESGRKQIWIMNSDGSEQANLSSDSFNDWDPVWIP